MPTAAQWRLVATAGFLLAGCGPAVQSTPFASFPARPAEHPIRLYSTKVPECPYEEVGLVSARRRYGLVVSMTEVLEALKARAREMGGDAVLRVSEGRVVSGGGQDAVTVSSTSVLSGTVIRFARPDCRQ